MRRLFLSALALAASGCTPAVCPPGTAEVGAYVRGRVASTDGADGRPVEAAEVTLTDAAGGPIAGLPRARTDAQGDFLAPKVPPGHSYVVVARYPGPDGDDTTLKTLAKPGTDPNAFQDLSPASTIVTTALTRDRTGLPGDFAATTYARAVDLVDAKLAEGGPAPDLDDPTAVTVWLEARAAEDAALQGALAELRPQVAAVEPRARVESEARAADPDPLDALKPVY